MLKTVPGRKGEMAVIIKEMRDQIDQIDKKIVELLAQRQTLVRGIGRAKAKLGLPVYAPDRELALIHSRKAEAKDLDLSPRLVEDILCRVMRESYSRERETGFKCLNPALGLITIIEEARGIGSLFAKMLLLSGYKVRVLGSDQEQETARDLLRETSLVMISSSDGLTSRVLDYLECLSDSCILCCLTWVSFEILQQTMSIHRGPVLALCPLFDPDVVDLAKQVIVCCRGRCREHYQWLIEQLAIWGSTILECENVETYESTVMLSQSLQQFKLFLYGYHLCKEGPDLGKLLEASSPSHRIELMMVGQLFRQHSDSYRDMTFSPKKKNIGMIERFLESCSEVAKMLSRGDRLELSECVNDIVDFFEDYSPKLTKEYRDLLERVNDSIHKGI